MKGINRTGAPLVHVPGWVGGWVDGWVDGSKSRFKDCLQQSKIFPRLCVLQTARFPTTLLAFKPCVAQRQKVC
jgi:hypothetical protein